MCRGRTFGSVYTDLMFRSFMFSMMRVILFTTAFQVSWLPDQGACAYLQPWPAGIFLASFLRQFGITMLIIKGVMFQLELIVDCYIFCFWAFVFVISILDVIKFCLTWLDLDTRHYGKVAHISHWNGFCSILLRNVFLRGGLQKYI